jgi:sugar fermentation stimulation protein A
MIYPAISEGIFLARPNRFVANVAIGGKTEICHVKNTGRCKELLIPGTKVYVNRADNPARVTKYDLISVYKSDRLINMDSGAPNQVFGEYLKAGRFLDGITLVKPETKYGNSRFDFYVEAGSRKIFIEVKGVTLEENGVALFPDAPTERGVKHLRELAACIEHGYEAHVIFVVQMRGVTYFTPNMKTHPAFGDALSTAEAAGVTITALDCEVTPDSLEIKAPVPVRLAL